MRKFRVRINGEEFEVEVSELQEETSPRLKVQKPESKVESESTSGSSLRVTTTLRAPMPGRILEVNVQKGQKIEAGHVAFVLEAMKMENEIVVENAGVVAQVYVEENDIVDHGDPLAEIEELR